MSPRLILTALAAGAALLGPAAAAAPAADDCAVPDAGFHACLQVRYATATDGTVQKVRATATLLQRVGRCSAVRARGVAFRVDGAQVAADRPAPTCRSGVARWRTVFTPGETADWPVRPGSTILTRWDGTTATASVGIAKPGAKPQKGRTVRGVSR
ncbi:MAG: hypothetical protein QOF17_894 [Solirubrobacteraceae bacterium]|nr:hypothetical protein [Solirubrobacteraceae bacterium]